MIYSLQIQIIWKKKLHKAFYSKEKSNFEKPSLIF